MYKVQSQLRVVRPVLRKRKMGALINQVQAPLRQLNSETHPSISVRKNLYLCLVAHTCHSSTREAEAGGLLKVEEKPRAENGTEYLLSMHEGRCSSPSIALREEAFLSSHGGRRSSSSKSSSASQGVRDQPGLPWLKKNKPSLKRKRKRKSGLPGSTGP